MISELRDIINQQVSRFDEFFIEFSARYGVPFLRLAIGIVFIWFGILKTMGDLSPAFDLIAATVYWLTPEIIVPLLGLWE
jgi:hypothetical protein